MISVSGKYWEEICINKRIIEKVKNENNFSEIISKLIISRNFNESEIYSIKNDIEIKNPFLNNTDYICSYNTLNKVINNKGKICIIGDYDVDGAVSTSLMIKLLEKIDINFFYHIPDRIKDGYGASLKLIKKLIIKKPDLIIMLDCGSSSNKSIDFLNKHKIETIIIDHHEIYKPFPKTKNIINPKKNSNYEEFNYLCTGALTYFFIDFFIKKEKLKLNFENNLIFVLLATICDVMPIRKLNRILAINILKKFKISDNIILKYIFDILKIKRTINLNDFAFLIGPILNSSGRIGSSAQATELLVEKNISEIKKKISNLIKINEKRKLLEENIFNEFDLNQIKKKNENVIVFFKKNLNEGLIGIIAVRLKEYFNKPSVVLTNSNNTIKASARSTENFNIGMYIKKAIDLNIIDTGGGHNLAAGFNIKTVNIPKFTNFINSEFIKTIKNDNIKKNYISKISLSAVNKKFYDEINKISPFGAQNPTPVFLIENLKIIKKKIIKNKYISCILKSNTGKTVNSISFNLLNSEISNILLNYKNEIKIIGEIKENLWNNKKTLQVIILDIIVETNKA